MHSAAQPEPTPIYNRLNTCFAFWVGDSDVDSQDQGSHKVQVLRENRLSRHSWHTLRDGVNITIHV